MARNYDEPQLIQHISDNGYSWIDSTTFSVPHRNSSWSTLIQWVAPFPDSNAMKVEFLHDSNKGRHIITYQNLRRAKNIDGTLAYGKDVVDPDQPYYQDVKDYGVWEVELYPTTLRNISKFGRAGKVGYSFTNHEYVADANAINKIGTFGSPFSQTGGDLPASATTIGDYYECDSLDYYSASTGFTFSHRQVAIWDGSAWVQGNNFIIDDSTEVRFFSASSALNGITPSVDPTLTDTILTELAEHDADIADLKNGNVGGDFFKDFKGYYETEAALLVDYPNGIANPDDRAGWFASVYDGTTTYEFYDWNRGTNTWVNSNEPDEIGNRFRVNETDITTNADDITTIKGVGWTTETIKQNADDIDVLESGKLDTTGKAADSELLDGLDASEFLRSQSDDNVDGILTYKNDMIVDSTLFEQESTSHSLRFTAVGSDNVPFERAIYLDSDDVLKQTGGTPLGQIDYIDDHTWTPATAILDLTGVGLAGTTITLSGLLKSAGDTMTGDLTIDRQSGLPDSHAVEFKYLEGLTQKSEKLYAAETFSEGDDAILKWGNEIVYHTGNLTAGATGFVDIASDQTITGLKTFDNQVVITGNLTVQGTTTTIDTETVTIADNIIQLNSDYVGTNPTVNAGIEVNRGGDVSNPDYFFIFDETNDDFRIGKSGSLQPVLTRNEDSSFEADDLLVWDSVNKRAIGKTPTELGIVIDSDLTTTLADYVAKTGSTMTGDLNMDNANIVIDNAKVILDNENDIGGDANSSHIQFNVLDSTVESTHDLYTQFQDKKLIYDGSQVHTDADFDHNDPVFNSVESGHISFDITSSEPVYAEGTIYWDPIKKEPTVMFDEPDIRLNMGFELWDKIYWPGPGTLLNGTVVTPTSSTFTTGSGDVVSHFEKADARYKDKTFPISVATHDIEAGTVGYVTKAGNVGGIDTSAWTAPQQTVYLGTSGQITPTRPEDGHYPVIVGHVVEYGLQGSIDVEISASELTVDITNQNGFPRSERFKTSFNVDATFHTFTLIHSSDYHFYDEGIKYEKTNNQSVAFPDTEGTKLFKFVDGVLTTVDTPTEAQLQECVLHDTFVAYGYWNFDEQKMEYLLDERHGLLDPEAHLQQHLATGTFYINGMALTITNIDGSGNDLTSVEYALTSGVEKDEDIEHNIIGKTTTDTIDEKYFFGPTGKLRTQSNNAYGISTGVAYPYYNEFTGTQWQLTEVPSGYFWFRHIYALPSEDKTSTNYYAFMGTDVYTTKDNAEGGLLSDVILLESNIPAPEFVHAYSIMYESKNSYSNAYKSRIVSTSDGNDAFDFRLQTTRGTSSTSATSHPTLSQRDAAGSHPATAISVDTTNFDEISVLATDVQSALDSVDDKLVSAASTSFADNEFEVYNNLSGTPGKLIFDASSIADLAVRTITMPNTDIDLGNIATNAANISDNDTDITNLQNNKVDNTTYNTHVALQGVGSHVPSGGVAGKFLYYDGTWSTPSYRTSITELSEPLQTDSIWYTDDSGNWQNLTYGAAGQVLKSNGPTVAPSWQVDNDSVDYINGSGFVAGTLSLSGVGSAGTSISLDGRYALLGGDTFTGPVQTNSGLIVNTNTNTDHLYVSRSGSTDDQVMAIGVSDRVAEFKYIEDTLAEGNGNFGEYQFILAGNDGEPEVTPLILGKNTSTLDGSLTITNNLIVQGTTTTVNSNTVNIGDNILLLNSDETGTPSQNGGFEIERGTDTNVSLYWNETFDDWFITDNAGNPYGLLHGGNFIAGTDYNATIGTDTDLDTAGAEVIDTMVFIDGVVDSYTKRTLTLGQLGYTGDLDANNYSWTISDGLVGTEEVTDGSTINFVGGTGITTSYTPASDTLTITNTVSNTNDYLDSASFNNTTGVLTYTVGSQANVTVDIDGRYPLTSGTQSITGNWTYTNDLTLDKNGTTEVDSHAITFKAESAFGGGDFQKDLYMDKNGQLKFGTATVGTDADVFVNGLSFNNGTGVLSATRTEGAATLTVDLDGRYLEIGGDQATGSMRFSNDNNYFGISGTNEAEIWMQTGNAGSPQIGLTDNNGDMAWAIGADDDDNNFKIHSDNTGTIPTINGLVSPIFEIVASTGKAIMKSGATVDNFEVGGGILFLDSFELANNADVLEWDGNKVWHAGNDGVGSTLDADLLDAQQGTYYLDYNNFTNTPTIPDNTDYVDLVSAQTIAGIKTFSNNVIMNGDLTVNGTTTTLNTATLEVEDKNIELGKVGTPSDTTADGGGITLKGTTDKTILWQNADDRWHYNQDIQTPDLWFDSGAGTSGDGFIHSAKSISFNWGTGTYDNPQYHGIQSTSIDGVTFADNLSINSYDDITLRLDSNNNGTNEAFRIGSDNSGTPGTWDLELIPDTDTFTYKGQTIYHSGNLPSSDNYGSWSFSATDTQAIGSGETVTFAGSGATSVTNTGNTITISSTDTNTTYTAGTGLTLTTTEFAHADTSAQASVDNIGRTYIQDITLDEFGHVTGLASATETVVNTDTNYYANGWSWTAGTSAGPTATIAINGTTDVSVSSVPIASAANSGVVTTSNQSFAGVKTFTGGIKSDSLTSNIGNLVLNGNGNDVEISGTALTYNTENILVASDLDSVEWQYVGSNNDADDTIVIQSEFDWTTYDYKFVVYASTNTTDTSNPYIQFYDGASLLNADCSYTRTGVYSSSTSATGSVLEYNAITRDTILIAIGKGINTGATSGDTHMYSEFITTPGNKSSKSNGNLAYGIQVNGVTHMYQAEPNGGGGASGSYRAISHVTFSGMYLNSSSTIIPDGISITTDLDAGAIDDITVTVWRRKHAWSDADLI